MSKLVQLAERAEAVATLLDGITPPTLEESHLAAQELEAITDELYELQTAYRAATLYQALAKD